MSNLKKFMKLAQKIYKEYQTDPNKVLLPMFIDLKDGDKLMVIISIGDPLEFKKQLKAVAED